VSSATTVGKDWLAAHARTVKGKTVLDLGGIERKLPRVELSQLVRGATSA
jgi:predicted nicotinamide N-methyase